MADYIDMTFKSGDDMSAEQYYICKMGTAAGTVVACAAATDKPIGIVQNKPNSATGSAVTVRIFGRSKCNANAALAVNDVVGPAADGQGDVYVAGTDTTKYAVGICTRAVSNAGEIAEVIVIPGFAKLS